MNEFKILKSDMRVVAIDMYKMIATHNTTVTQDMRDFAEKYPDARPVLELILAMMGCAFLGQSIDEKTDYSFIETILTDLTHYGVKYY